MFQQEMKLNIDDTEPMKNVILVQYLGYGFVKETAAFIISDDLYVMPNVFGTVMQLLQKLDISDIGAITELTVDISKKEACFLMQLASKLLSTQLIICFLIKYFYFCR